MNSTLLKQVKSWQKAIASQLIGQNPQLSLLQSNRISQALTHQMLCLHLCEQRQILTAESHQDSQSSNPLYSRLVQLFAQQPDCPAPFFLNNLPRSTLHSLSALKLSQSRLPIEFLGQAYEQSCNTRKSNGIYYTPPAIVHYIIQNTLPNILVCSPQAPLRILDPACGGGAFLLAAYQFLLDWQLQQYLDSDPSHFAQAKAEKQPRLIWKDDKWQLSQAERSRILLEHIYGLDLDPQAVAVTQHSLWLKLLEDAPDRSLDTLPNLSHNIQCGNALIHPDFYRLFPAHPHPTDQTRAIDWEKTFPEILKSGGFDAVIGNPPYIDSESMTVYLPDWRRYCSTRYRTATGNWDIFCLFIEKAIDLCRPDGLTSLVVPNKLITANYAAAARQLLTHENQLLCLRDYSQVPVFPAAVYPLVYIARKQAPQPKTIVQYEQMQGLEQVRYRHSLTFCHSDPPTLPWTIAHPQQTDLITRLQQTFPLLSSVAQVRGAATVAEAYALQALIQDSSTIAQNELKLVNSGTIDRYQFLWGKKPLRYLGASYLHPIVRHAQIAHLSAKRQQQATQAKIIVAGMTRVLECALDETGSLLAGKSTSVIQSTQPTIDLRYLLGLLNSHLLSFYFATCFGGNRFQGGFLRVGPPQLRQLPIAVPDLSNPIEQRLYEQITALVTQLLTAQAQQLTCTKPQMQQSLKQDCNRFEQAIDQQIYRLYRLTDAELEIVEKSKNEL